MACINELLNFKCIYMRLVDKLTILHNCLGHCISRKLNVNKSVELSCHYNPCGISYAQLTHQ